MIELALLTCMILALVISLCLLPPSTSSRGERPRWLRHGVGAMAGTVEAPRVYRMQLIPPDRQTDNNKSNLWKNADPGLAELAEVRGGAAIASR
jgi:hypothetical protein